MLTLVRMHRAIRLTGLTTHAWLLLLLFDIVALAGFSHVHARLRRRATRPTCAALRVDDIIWAVDEACVWYFKRAACLQRSAVSTWLLRGCGITAELVIGYRPTPFESHAWVEVAGHIVNDRQQYQKFFAVLERL